MNLNSDTFRAFQDDPILYSPLALVTTVNVAFVYLLWYIAVTHWNVANYAAWVRFNGPLLGNTPSTQLYLGFVVLSEIVLWLVGGPLLFYAARYPKGRRHRNTYLGLAIALTWLGSDIPLFVLDVTIAYNYGLFAVVQVSALLLRGISFFAGGVVTWQMYLFYMSKILQRRYETNDERRLLAEREELETARRAMGIRSAVPRPMKDIVKVSTTTPGGMQSPPPPPGVSRRNIPGASPTRR